ncbi:uncharacterized protein LAESUDRAFT_727677 [Laetiporus sulphureus 93-53]|uniref:Uncharacterized protein n=1 Tax=Laetiporus sulphureus 93-53 TaxID=1314785 RepID=A0A165DFY9_9APHY|nr:uncharacterized protein LAESUDRAFT_727677 [Laetiporus sulphureus 93-53]KZT04808.1 hypothetical protein LAESUDRAFT_727677 [Laetiporus sulphureus 93-53]
MPLGMMFTNRSAYPYSPTFSLLIFAASLLSGSIAPVSHSSSLCHCGIAGTGSGSGPHARPCG